MTMPLVSMYTRRSALMSASAAGFGLFTLGRNAAMAQDATPPAFEIPEIIRKWVTATEAEDTDGLLALYTSDVFFESVPIGEVANGSEEFRAANQAQFDSYTDITVELTSAFQAGDWMAAEGIYSGIYSGQIVGLPPGTGQSVVTRFVSIFELRDGLISRESDYYDAYSMLTQLGAFDAPAEEATPST